MSKKRTTLFGKFGLAKKRKKKRRAQDKKKKEKKKGGKKLQGSHARERGREPAYSAGGGARTVKGGAAWRGAEQGRVWQPTGSDLVGETGTHTVKHETFCTLHFWCSPLPHE